MALKAKETPLKNTQTPAQMLALVRQTNDVMMKMIMLMGYFFSLRPQEIFAVKQSKFLAGSKAVTLECCRSMSYVKLYGWLAYYVSEQREKSGTIEIPTARSKGWSACFNEEAAQLIVGLIGKNNPDDLYFGKYQNDHWFRKWRELPSTRDMTIKDLRRAGLYWLDHSTELTLAALKNHAGHSKIETTMKNVRRPETTPIEQDSLDQST